jgi:hypothetical protein
MLRSSSSWDRSCVASEVRLHRQEPQRKYVRYEGILKPSCFGSKSPDSDLSLTGWRCCVAHPISVLSAWE